MQMAFEVLHKCSVYAKPEQAHFWRRAHQVTVYHPTSPLLWLLPLTFAQMIHFAQSFVNSNRSQLEFGVHLNYTCSATSSTEGIHFSLCLWWGHSNAHPSLSLQQLFPFTELKQHG